MRFAGYGSRFAGNVEPLEARCLLAANVLINEIMYHPASNLPADEYIELFNQGNQSANLKNWQFTSGVSYTLGDVTLAAGQYLVVAADPAAFAVTHPGVTNVVGPWVGTLSDSGERIALSGAAGALVDAVSYADQGDWGRRVQGLPDRGHTGWDWQSDADGLGRSLELTNPALINDLGQNWLPSTVDDGTPGAANSTLSASIAPLISVLNHAPNIPRSTDSVTVTAKLTDELGGANAPTATLFWRVDGAPDFTQTPMYDDGVHGDGSAGDGTYGASIGPQADLTVVEFYVQATDKGGQSRTLPAPTYGVGPTLQQLTNALYQVDNSYNPAAPWVPGSQPQVRLVMTEAQRKELADIGANVGGAATSNALMNATFISNDGTSDNIRYSVGVRNRGHGSRFGPPNNYHLDVPHDNPWKGVTSLTLNCRNTHAQILGSVVFRMADLAAGDAGPTQVRINGVVKTPAPAVNNTYAQVEQPDNDFVNKHFADDPGGNLYSAYRLDDNSQRADFRYEGPLPSPYRDTYFKQNNQAADDWSDLIHLTDVIANTPDATYFQEVSQVIDVPQWMRYLALNSLMLNLESGLLGGIGDDFALYRGVNDTRFQLIPHDLDTVFQLTGGNINASIFGYTGVFGLGKILSNADFLPLYYQAYIDLFATVFNHAVLDPVIDQAAGSFVSPATLAAMKQFITDRTAAVLAQIPRAFTVTSGLPLQSGFPRTPNSSTSLSGQGDVVTTRSILINGQPAVWNGRTGAWSIGSVPLNPGINRVVVEAYDGPSGSGALVNSTFIDIWRDAGTVVTPGANYSLPFGTVWRYLDDGSDQGVAWRGEAFSDSAWKNGIGQIGWGDGDEATSIAAGNQGHKTYYFRQTFTIPAGQAATFTTAAIDLIYDDGARVYLNNTEIFRGNLPGVLGDETINSTTQASSNRGGGVENAIVTQAFSPALLHDGVNTIAVEIHQFDTVTDLGLDLRLRTKEFATDPQPLLIGAGSMWRYLDTGVEPAAGWKTLGPGPGTPNFDDGAWKAGRAQLGYSDNPPENDEATIVDYGSDPINKRLTTWFRKSFTLLPGEAGILGSASITLTLDDGASVYLNGVEVIRENLPGLLGDGTITAATPADASYENFVKNYPINAGLLRDGVNILAVEVHQRAVDSSDLSFDLELIALPTAGGGATTNLSGLIAANTTLTAAAGPYRVVGDVTVPVGVTLTIEPGTTIFFDQDRQVVVNGRLLAEGTRYNHIRLTRAPGSTAVWGGLQFKNTLQDNRLTYADLEWGGTANNQGMVGLDGSNLTIDHAYFDHAERRRIRSQTSSLIVRDSYFNDLFAPGIAPTTDNFSEHIWGGFIPANGHWIVERNYFGLAKGHNDMIDFDAGTRPGAVPQIRFNTFAGGGDDAMDLEGDAHIEGNLIYNMVKDQWNTGAGNSNGMSLGAGHHYVVERNTFVHNQHVAQVKDNSFLTFVNNTVIDSNFLDPINSEQLGAIYFIRAGVGYGKGAYLDGNIFVDTPLPLDKIGPAVDAVIHRSIVPASFVGRGVGNLTEDPRLRNKSLAGLDVSLRPGSPALGAGPNGLDMGAAVAAGAKISGEPPSVTSLTSATLIVGGPDTWAYKYRVNGGVWSAPVVVANPGLKNQVIPPIQLNGLADGDYTVEVVRQNSAFEWQADAAATKSKTWTVENPLSRLVINEVLAENLGAVPNGATRPDVIELYNGGSSAVDLGGMSLTDDPASPTQFVFAPGTTVPAGGYLVLYADSAAGEPGIHTGFEIDGKGEAVYLFDAAARGGAQLDSVIFGNQLPNRSIGRVGQDAHWALTAPTFGAANVAERTGDPATLKINEWFANGKQKLVDDFIELYNADPLPVNLAGLWITNDPTALPHRHQIAPLSFVAGAGFGVLTADNLVPLKPGHLNFKLDAEGALLALYDANSKLIDKLVYFGQTTDFSQGRSPDGAIPLAFYGLPTPGLTNSAAANPAMAALVANLRVSEIMYNSVGGSSYEYIELTNIGAAPLDVGGVRLAKAIDFTFPPLVLTPGQRVVVVADQGAFRSRYGASTTVVGQYLGSLSDGGEPVDLKLPEPFDAAIQRFAYNDKWYSSTDGGGYALEVVDAAANVVNWDKKQGWKAGAAIGGSPGLGDPAAPISFVVTNVNDAGPGSLRQAMLDVEAAPVGYQHVISFNIGGASPYAMQLQSRLPDLTQPVTLDVALGKEIDIGTATPFSLGELPALSKAGGGQLVLGGDQSHVQPTRLNVNAGTLEIRSDIGANVALFASGNTANVLLTASQNLAALSLSSAAKVRLWADDLALQTGSLSIDASGALLDLRDGALIVDYTGVSSPAVLIESYLRSGVNLTGTTWDGPGIMSSTARDDVSFATALGMIDNANIGYVARQGVHFSFEPGGAPVPAASVLVKFTYTGDADLNGVVDGDDLVSLLVGYSAQAHGWDLGDFDYSGLTDGDDLTSMLYGFQNQGAPLAVGKTAAAPATLAENQADSGTPTVGLSDAALADAALADIATSDWRESSGDSLSVGAAGRRRKSGY